MVRKISIDIIYALSVLLPKRMIRFKRPLLSQLILLKTDKNSSVREANRATMKILKAIKIPFSSEIKREFVEKKLISKKNQPLKNTHQRQPKSYDHQRKQS